MKHSTLSMLSFAILFTFALSLSTRELSDSPTMHPVSKPKNASSAEMCDVARLKADAARVPGCANAIASQWENAEETCACWEAMGEQYRTDNFGCTPIEKEPTTLMDLYNKCGQTVECPEEKSCQDGTKISCSKTFDGCSCDVCPTKEVKFEFEASITKDQFISEKVNITEKMAILFDVRGDYVTLDLKGSTSFRPPNGTLTEGVLIAVTIKAENKNETDDITNQIQQVYFKYDLQYYLYYVMGSRVTVGKISQPTTTDIKVETPASDGEQCPEVQTCKDGTKISCSGTVGDCDCEVCPTKEVKFGFQATISSYQFDRQRANMTAEMARLLKVRKDYVNLDYEREEPKGNATARRTLNEGLYIIVTVKAENEAQATAITNQVRQEDFKVELEDSLTRVTGSKVTVERVSEPTTTSINVETTEASEDKSKNNTVIIVVVVLSVLAVLGGTGALAYYHYFLSDGIFFDHKGGDAGDLECANDLECTNDCDLQAAIQSLDL